MTASESPLDHYLLAVELITNNDVPLTAAAVTAHLPLGVTARDAKLASLEARLLGLTDRDGLTPAGRERLNACPARRALLALLSAAPLPLEAVA